MKTPITLFDLNKSASVAAEAAQDKNTHQIALLKLEAFDQGGFDPLDYQTWEGFFNGHFASYANFRTRKSPATVAAEIAAAAAAAPKAAAQ